MKPDYESYVCNQGIHHLRWCGQDAEYAYIPGLQSAYAEEKGPEAGDYNSGEYEELLEKHGKNPDMYVMHDTSIGHGYFGKKERVWDCPCNDETLGPIEAFIWYGRFAITDYLKKRVNKELDHAKRQHQVLGIDELEKRMMGRGF